MSLAVRLLASGVVCWLAFVPAEDLNRAVRIDFPKDGYTFTLAEVAKGVRIRYQVVVDHDCEAVSPRPFGPSFAETPGPSGLYPRERISGNGHNFCLEDFGLGHPPREEDQRFVTLKKGTYLHSFEWDGRNWNGPSDTSNPRGEPFPAGTYKVTVTMHGVVRTDSGEVPYQITGTTKLVLK